MIASIQAIAIATRSIALNALRISVTTMRPAPKNETRSTNESLRSSIVVSLLADDGALSVGYECGASANLCDGTLVHRGLRREQIELHDVPEGGDAIGPPDFLSLGVRAAAVADRHFVDSRTRLGETRSELRLEAKSVRRKWQTPHQVGAHHLVAGLHVGDVEIGEHVRQRREAPVAK